MSASSRRTVDTDNITLRTIYARGSNNTNIQSTLTLTADGRGGTRWVHPSSLGAYSLNYVSTDVSVIQWDLSLNNVFYLTGGQGIGIQSSPTNSHQSIVYAKAYQAFRDVNSGGTMTTMDAWKPGRQYSTVYSTVNISTTSWQIYASICSPQQTLYLNTNPIKFLVIPGVSSINTDYINRSQPFSSLGASLISSCISSIDYPLSTFLSTFHITLYNTSTFYNEVNIDSVNSTIRFYGVRDLQLSTVFTSQRAVFFSLSTFTSEGYLGLSGEISSLRSLSTTMPYNFRSSILLTPNNAFLKPSSPMIQNYLSTFYTGVWTANFIGTPGINPSSMIIQSSIGFPYTPLGLRGTNIITTSNNVSINGSLYTINITENVTNQYAYSGDAYISSLTFNMSPFSTLINRNLSASITLSYTPSFLLTPSVLTSAGNSNNFNLGFSTFLSYGGLETVPGTFVEDMFYAANTGAASNPLYGRLLIDLPKNYVSSHYLSNYTVYHYFPNALAGYSNPNNVWPPTSYSTIRAGLSTPQITSYTSKQNMAYITIIGS
jgi:hypothetical protein